MKRTELIDSHGGSWIAWEDDRPAPAGRQVWTTRGLGNKSPVLPALYGFYAADLAEARAKLGA